MANMTSCSARPGQEFQKLTSEEYTKPAESIDAHAKKALELTFREALRMNHNHVGTEHILLALLEVEDGTGVLGGLGVDKAIAEASITAALAASPES